MFYYTSIQKDINVFPYEIDQDLTSIIKTKLRNEEGKIYGAHGYIVSVLQFSVDSYGRIDSDSGQTIYNVNFKAITLRLEKNEVVLGKPYIINEHGFFCSVGPIIVFTSKHMMPTWDYDSSQNIWIRDSEIVSLNKNVKLKILASRINANEITATATI